MLQLACTFLHLHHPTLDPCLWTLDELKNSLVCNTCLLELNNWWHVCLRRSCAINLHPEYLSRGRQMFFMVIQILKYLPVPTSYYGPIIHFKGPHKPIVQDNPRSNSGLPKYLQPKKLIRCGEYFILFE